MHLYGVIGVLLCRTDLNNMSMLPQFCQRQSSCLEQAVKKSSGYKQVCNWNKYILVKYTKAVVG